MALSLPLRYLTALMVTIRGRFSTPSYGLNIFINVLSYLFPLVRLESPSIVKKSLQLLSSNEEDLAAAIPNISQNMNEILEAQQSFLDDRQRLHSYSKTKVHLSKYALTLLPYLSMVIRI
jgi:hypothetical protein